MASGSEYIQRTLAICDVAVAEESESISAAAKAVAVTLESGGIWWLFGTGHSHTLAEEMWGRAGGLVSVRAILEPSLMLHEGLEKSTRFERLPGLAAAIAPIDEWKAGDVITVISNSGRNAVPVEMALLAREQGLTVTALTSLSHSKSVESRAPSGDRLFEVADIVIDNHGTPGDAVVSRSGDLNAIGATSTVVGALLLQAIATEAVAILDREGASPEIYLSVNK